MGRFGFKPLDKEPEPLYKTMARNRVMEKLEAKYPFLVPGKRYLKRGTDKVNQLILTPEAAKELMDYFKWGVTHPNNVFEQQAALVGYLFKDPATGRFTAVAECLVPAMAHGRSPVGASLTADDTANVQCEVNVMNRNLRKAPNFGVFTQMGEMMIVAWVHSHPNELDVFLSSTDQKTHLSHYGSNEDSMGISMVVNPHRGLARAFGGVNMKELEVVWICEAADYARLTGESVPHPVYMEVAQTGRAASFVKERETERVREPMQETVKPPVKGEIPIEGPGDVAKKNPTGIIREGDALGRKEDVRKTITTPTGGAWPCDHRVSDGSQSRVEIKYKDITGQTCYYPSSEEYYLKHGYIKQEEARLGYRPFSRLRDTWF